MNFNRWPHLDRVTVPFLKFWGNILVTSLYWLVSIIYEQYWKGLFQSGICAAHVARSVYFLLVSFVFWNNWTFPKAEYQHLSPPWFFHLCSCRWGWCQTAFSAHRTKMLRETVSTRSWSPSSDSGTTTTCPSPPCHPAFGPLATALTVMTAASAPSHASPSWYIDTHKYTQENIHAFLTCI